MPRRTWHLFRARLAMARRGGWPIPALVFLASLGSALALLVRDLLPPFPYALFALSVGASILALPLLSDLGALLRHDEGGEWLGSLPARAPERTLARTLHLLVVLAALVLAWFAPFAGFASRLALPARLALPLSGFALVLLLATLLIWAQQLLLERLQGLFVLLETGLMVFVVVALVEVLGHLPELAKLAPDSPGMSGFPPAWFARPLAAGGSAWLPAAIAAASFGALLAVPAGERRQLRRRRGLERWLGPLRWLATRFWVRPEERGAFELVYTALPREREVALRTIPMLGIPLAFLWISAGGAQGGPDSWRGDLLALLLFTVGVYLPLLLTHVPLSESPQASWILRTAPLTEGALVGGTIKALFARWLLPLYLGLLGLGWILSEVGLLARLWLPATLLALILVRLLYPRCVRDLPLSTGPEELRSEVDWAGHVTGLAVGLTLLAVLANRSLGWRGGLGFALLLGLCEWGLERRLARSGRARPAGAGEARG